MSALLNMSQEAPVDLPKWNVPVLRCTCPDHQMALRMARLINADSMARLNAYYKEEGYDMDTRTILGIGRGCTIQELDDGSFAVEEEPDWDVLDAAKFSMKQFHSVLADIDAGIMRALAPPPEDAEERRAHSKKLVAIIKSRWNRTAPAFPSGAQSSAGAKPDT